MSTDLSLDPKALDGQQRLFANLQTTHQVYQQLLELAEKKRAHIIANDIEELRADLAAEERLAAEGATLGAERESLHRQCCAALEVRAQGSKLEDLCRAMPPEWARRFQRERDGLRRTLDRLLRVNRANVVLVNNSLQLMRGLLAALFGAEQVSAYGRRGVRSETELTRRVLDTSG